MPESSGEIILYQCQQMSCCINTEAGAMHFSPSFSEVAGKKWYKLFPQESNAAKIWNQILSGNHSVPKSMFVSDEQYGGLWDWNSHGDLTRACMNCTASPYPGFRAVLGGGVAHPYTEVSVCTARGSPPPCY